jgi:hypothetical protein
VEQTVLAFADHALVCIVKGIHRKWKQTVCFTFCEGTTATAELVNISKQIIRQIRSCNLRILSTTSDQGSINQVTINKLLLETNTYFLSQNVENLLHEYSADGEEIVHLYDFSHLMKCVRNLLLYEDLQYIQDGEEKVASWSNIIRIYEMDKSKGIYSQFSKLTF